MVPDEVMAADIDVVLPLEVIAILTVYLPVYGSAAEVHGEVVAPLVSTCVPVSS
jgi:hypothetical protein